MKTDLKTKKYTDTAGNEICDCSNEDKDKWVLDSHLPEVDGMHRWHCRTCGKQYLF